jgi:DNA (cytosine-5)-methyltransferase 1
MSVPGVLGNDRTDSGGSALTVGSLFSGIGGLELGLERAGMRVIWQVEVNPFARAILAKHWPDVPKYGDVTNLDWSTLERPDVLCGGFPCQDISSAGLKTGIGGKRSGLWRYFAYAIRDLEPRFVVVENVADLAVRGLDVVLGDLAELGFDAEWSTLSACAVGAPHMRRRLFIVAYRPRGDESDQVSYDALSLRGQPDWQGQPGGSRSDRRPRWLPEPDVGRVADGIPRRLVAPRLSVLGNAVVPACAEYVGRRVMAAAA